MSAKNFFLMAIYVISNTLYGASDIKVLEKECLQGNLASCVKKEAILSGLDKEGEVDKVVIGEKKLTASEKRRGYKLDCDAFQWSACHNLAVLEENDGNNQLAIKLYDPACFKGGIADSCHNLGVLHNTKKLKKPAIKAFDEACKLNHFVSCYDLGILEFDNGHKERAQKLFTKACHGKVKEACQKNRDKFNKKNKLRKQTDKSVQNKQIKKSDQDK